MFWHSRPSPGASRHPLPEEEGPNSPVSHTCTPGSYSEILSSNIEIEYDLFDTRTVANPLLRGAVGIHGNSGQSNYSGCAASGMVAHDPRHLRTHVFRTVLERACGA